MDSVGYFIGAHGIPELTVCHCNKSACGPAECAYRTNSIPCTEACTWLAGENCQNPNSTRQFTDEGDTDR